MFKNLITIIIILILPVTAASSEIYFDNDKQKEECIINSHFIYETVIIPDNNPFYGIIGSSISCTYDKSKGAIIKPLLVNKNGKLTNQQIYFLKQLFLEKEKKILIIGEKIKTNFDKTEILGNVANVSIVLAEKIFKHSDSILIIPEKGNESYNLGITAAPLASYLNIPLIIYNENEKEIYELCKKLEVKNAYIIGNNNLNITNITVFKLKNIKEIQDEILETIKEKFGEINYITITNPSDTIPRYIKNLKIQNFTDHVTNYKLILFGKSIDIKGSSNKNYTIDMPYDNGSIEIYVNISKSSDKLFGKILGINPIINLYLYDSEGNIISYSSSLGYDVNKAYTEVLICNAKGKYNLDISFYNGIKGGYFSQRGVSITDLDYDITIKKTELEKPHFPLIPNLSMISAYLTSAHGGILIANPKFELTDDPYVKFTENISAGPSYNEELHEFNNNKVRYALEKINETLNQIENKDMLTEYLNGSAWLSILADTNMIPMYYYQPSQPGIFEKGLPSDNPYSLDFNLSVGRTISYDLQDTSLLIARTLFYNEICGNPDNWHKTFNFIFGEGFGETGGLFHQVPYSNEIKKYGFLSNVYGDLRNSRQISEILETYTNSNYIEYLGHGDWYWYTPSLYGFDMYSKAITVSQAKDWIYKKPSIFLTSACLMGRIDGIPPNMNIGLTMIHAGCNSFLGATRETGQEAGLEIFENHLIVDDLSIGEALRGEKRTDQEIPTFYVRTLYGDPAFNPYEPNNGYNTQGIPNLV